MDKIKSKIEKLLAKAERTDNEHEREAFTAQAQRLMLKWGIEAADLEARGEIKPEEIVEVSFTWNTTYAIAWRTFARYIANAMGNLRHLQSGSKSRHTAYIIGHKSDVENFWTLMHSLQAQATAALEQWWKTAPEREWGLTAREQYKVRRQFLLGYGYQCGLRLMDLRTDVEKQATPGAALVLVSKKERVDDALAAKYPKLGKGRGMTGAVSGTEAGRLAGQRANLGTTGIGDGTAGALQ